MRSGEGHLQPEPAWPRQPAVQVIRCVGQTEVNHGDAGPWAPGTRHGGSKAALLELPNYFSTHLSPACPPSQHKYSGTLQWSRGRTFPWRGADPVLKPAWAMVDTHCNLILLCFSRSELKLPCSWGINWAGYLRWVECDKGGSFL